MGSKAFAYVPPGGGENFNWSSDDIFVKVSSQDTLGQYTVIEDNLKANFSLGLHYHRYHAETFYILEGSVDFFVAGDWIQATKNSCLPIPKGVEHACTITENCCAARMLMIFQPAGFEKFLSEMAQMDEADFSDHARMNSLNEKYDIIKLGPVPNRIVNHN